MGMARDDRAAVPAGRWRGDGAVERVRGLEQSSVAAIPLGLNSAERGNGEFTRRLVCQRCHDGVTDQCAS